MYTVCKKNKLINTIKRILKTGLLGLTIAIPAILYTGILFSQPATGDAENLDIINWPGADYNPVVSPGGKYLFFQSDRPGSMEKSDLWMTTNPFFNDRSGPVRWTVPVPLRLPPFKEGSPTMRIVHPEGTVDSPPGGFQLNSNDIDGMASFIFEGEIVKEVFFTSKAGKLSGRDGYGELNIYHTRFVNDRWTKPVHINEINSHFNDRMPAISSDGRTMYFSSDRPGGYGGFDLWVSQRDESGRWSKPINAGEQINSPYNENAPVFAPGDDMLFFSSNKPGGFGYFDLYVTRYDGFTWSVPENLGRPFNSSRDDEYLSIGNHGLWGYFSSDRRSLYALGGFDIYRAPLPEWLRQSVEVLLTGYVLDGRTRKPLGVEATIRILYEKETIVGTSEVFRGEPDSDYAGNFAIRLQSGRIYRIQFSAPGFYPAEIVADYRGSIPPSKIDRRKIVLQPVKEDNQTETEIRKIPGRVIDADTGLSLPGSEVEFRIAGGNMKSIQVDQDGKFSITVPTGALFSIYARAPGYVPERMEYQERSDLKEIVIRLKTDPTGAVCPGEDPKCIDNIRIYFGLDSNVIRKSEKEKINAIVRIMKANPELKVEIQGHTDRTYRGPKDKAYTYNLRLSRSRAERTRELLINYGVNAKRLSIRGYSYLQPRVNDAVPGKRALNRRVEFRRVRKETEAGSDN